MQIKIAVASNIKFEHKTYPIVTASLIEQGIAPDDIHFFSGGYPEYKYELRDGIHYHQLDHNSYEYSPLIEIVERQMESEYWFLVHDTCKFGSRFKELLYCIPNYKPLKMAIKTEPAMSIGTYRYDYLLSLKEKLLAIKNKDYSKDSMLFWKDWGRKFEDYILWKTSPRPEVYNDDNRWAVTKYENWYDTPSIRRTEYYHSLDLYKNKSNWGQGLDLEKPFNVMMIDL